MLRSRQLTLKLRKLSRSLLSNTIQIRIKMTQMQQRQSSRSSQTLMKSCQMRKRDASMISKALRVSVRTRQVVDNNTRTWMISLLSSSAKEGEVVQVEEVSTSSTVVVISSRKKSFQISSEELKLMSSTSALCSVSIAERRSGSCTSLTQS